MENESLRACPFCGGGAAIDDVNSHPSRLSKPLWGVGCNNDACDVEAISTHTDRATAIAAWNTRVPSEGEPAIGEQEALRRAGEQFRDYERQHRAKGTPDGDHEAETNARMAMMCEVALGRSLPAVGNGDLLEIACRACEPDLFSEDETTAHRAASPLKVEVARERIRVKMGCVLAALRPSPPAGEPYQDRVAAWMYACFGDDITNDATERNFRFLEEALELVQSCGATREEAHRLVDYTFDRPEGVPGQEVGGVMVTLAALCIARQMDMAALGETELTRIWGKVEQIRAKHASKPKDVRSPLPGRQTQPDSGKTVGEAQDF